MVNPGLGEREILELILNKHFLRNRVFVGKAE
jgi:hypothetical protein